MDEEDAGRVCAVCLEQLADGTNRHILTECKHEFHAHCLKMMIECGYNACCLCKHPLPLSEIRELDPSYVVVQRRQARPYRMLVMSATGCIVLALGAWVVFVFVIFPFSAAATEDDSES